MPSKTIEEGYVTLSGLESADACSALAVLGDELPSDPKKRKAYQAQRDELERIETTIQAGEVGDGERRLELLRPVITPTLDPLLYMKTATLATFNNEWEKAKLALQHGIEAAVVGGQDSLVGPAYLTLATIELHQKNTQAATRLVDLAALWLHRVRANAQTLARGRLAKLDIALAEDKLETASDAVDSLGVVRLEEVDDWVVKTGVLRSTANYHQRRGEFGKALELWRQSLTITNETLGNNHPHYATALSNIAVALYKRGDMEAALHAHEEALQIMKTLLGDSHAGVVPFLLNAGVSHRGVGDLAGSERLLDEARALVSQDPEAGAPYLDVVLSGLATVYWMQGQLDKSLEINQELQAKRVQQHGESHSLVANSLYSIGGNLAHLKKYDEAISRLHRAWKIRESVYGPVHPEVGDALHALGELDRDQGLCAKAAPFYEQAKAAYFKTEVPFPAHLLISMGQCAAKRGLRKKSEDLLRRALSMTPKGNADWARATFALARLVVRESPSAAKALAEEALQAHRGNDPSDEAAAEKIRAWLVLR